MPTEKQYLSIPFEVKLEDIDEDGTFGGHASLFDQKPDSHRDLVARGAFTETLAEGGRNKSGIPMLWQHRSDKIPGVWLDLKEDTKGLMVQGKLALETQLGRDIYEIMKLGAKAGTFKFGLSIGYDSLDEEFHTPKDENRKIRTLKKVSLWEISLVTFPAKLGTNVVNIKKVKDAKTVREIEDALRDSGLSKAEAQQFIAVCKTALRDSETAEEEFDNNLLSEILDSLKMVNEDIQTAEILGSLKKINLKETDNA